MVGTSSGSIQTEGIEREQTLPEHGDPDAPSALLISAPVEGLEELPYRGEGRVVRWVSSFRTEQNMVISNNPFLSLSLCTFYLKRVQNVDVQYCVLQGRSHTPLEAQLTGELFAHATQADY